MGRGRALAYDVPIRCGEVLVRPSELITADFDRSVFVPRSVEEQGVRQAAVKIDKKSASRADLLAAKNLREVYDPYHVL